LSIPARILSSYRHRTHGIFDTIIIDGHPAMEKLPVIVTRASNCKE
jgi:hypothetical protein